MQPLLRPPPEEASPQVLAIGFSAPACSDVHCGPEGIYDRAHLSKMLAVYSTNALNTASAASL